MKLDASRSSLTEGICFRLHCSREELQVSGHRSDLFIQMLTWCTRWSANISSPCARQSANTSAGYSTTILWHLFLWDQSEGARILAVSSILSSPPSAASQYPSSLLRSTSPLSEMNKVFVLKFQNRELGSLQRKYPRLFPTLSQILMKRKIQTYRNGLGYRAHVLWVWSICFKYLPLLLDQTLRAQPCILHKIIP